MNKVDNDVFPLKGEDQILKGGERQEKEESVEELQNLYEESLKNIQEGEILKGKVIKIANNQVLVDIGFKSEGIIPLSEFPDPQKIQVGDEVEVLLESIESQEGTIVLSKQKADFIKVWDIIKEAFDTQKTVEGKVLRRIKGGMVVDVFGVDAFLPGSQIALRPVLDMDALIGQTIPLKVIKVNKKRRNIIVSRRIVLEEDRKERRRVLLSELAKDQVREGVVKNITDFGVFIDLGGVDGLLHITDMSWGRISHPSELLAIGNKVNVKILDFDKEKERVSLGLKQLTTYPWEKIEEKYPLGSKVRGKVVSITDYGAFIELEKGVEGLIHVSEMTWTREVIHPSKILAIGDMVEAVVLNINKEQEKISLSLKRAEPDPWSTIEQKYPLQSRVVGKVRNLTNFGAFVELEEGVNGLVHISDMSWTKRITHPKEVLKKGEKIEVIVLNIDKQNRRISLGLKQTMENPWSQIARELKVGSTVVGKVSKITERGLTIDLGENLEGFLPDSHIAREESKKLGEELSLKVIELNPQLQQIILSQKLYLAEQSRS